MALLPLPEAFSAIAVCSTCPSWTRRCVRLHRACQPCAARRTSSSIDIYGRAIRQLPR